MRRISLILTIAFVCLAGLTIVPGALAGNFDKDKMGCPGESPAACPTATVGQPYSLTIYLTPPDGGRGEDFNCARFHVSSGAFPPGLSVSDEGLVSGTPTTAGSYTVLPHGHVRQGGGNLPEAGVGRRSSRSTSIQGAAAPPPRRSFVTTASLPDGNVNQPYTAPGLTATGARSTSWTLAGGTLPAGLTLGAERRHHGHADAERARSRSPCRRTRAARSDDEAALAVRPRAARDPDAGRQDAARDRPDGQAARQRSRSRRGSRRSAAVRRTPSRRRARCRPA